MKIPVVIYVNVRMMDDGIPSERNSVEGVVSKNDICANVGVRIVKGLANDIAYNVVLGMNMFSVAV